MPSDDWNSSNLRTRRKHSRRISRLQRSPITATVRASEHGSSSRASHFINDSSESAARPQINSNSELTSFQQDAALVRSKSTLNDKHHIDSSKIELYGLPYDQSLGGSNRRPAKGRALHGSSAQGRVPFRFRQS